MTASTYTPSAEYPTYADYRRAKQREARRAWKERNAEKYSASENERRRAKYASDEGYAQKQRLRAVATYEANPNPTRERSRQRRAAFRGERAEYDQRYYAANKSAIQTYKKGWMKRNAARVNARNAARRALQVNATPVWADEQSICDVYAEAQHMQMHVDHIIPLNHPLVCGLHVWENLQLLAPEDNLRKNNKFDPENYDAS